MVLAGWRWLTMQWLWVVEGRGPWFYGAKLPSQLRHKLSSADEVSSSCQLRHQAAGWSFLLAGRAICQPRLGSAGRRGSQSPSSHLSPVTRPGTWSDQQSLATYDPSLIQPLGEIIRNTGCREKQREPACLVHWPASSQQPLILWLDCCELLDTWTQSFLFVTKQSIRVEIYQDICSVASALM